MGDAEDEALLLQLRDALRAAGPGNDEVAAADLVWLGRNVDRVDVRLRDANGREHHVVASTIGAAIQIDVVLAEPDQVPPHPAVVVVVNGPSGSGKSTLLRSIAEVSDVPWVTFDEPILGEARQSLLVWRDRAPHLHRGFIAGIAAVAAAGNAVAVAAGGHEQSQFRSSLANIRVLYVGLDCPIEVLVDRERGRADRWGGIAGQSARAHRGWTYDVRIDTTGSRPHEAARAVLSLLG